MAVDKKLLEILCCPVSKVPIVPLPKDRLDRLNAAITAGEVRYTNGDPVETTLEQGLITKDDKTIYRIDDDIPVMLEEKGIHTAQLKDF